MKMATCVLMLDAVSASGEVMTHNQVALAPPKGMTLPNATVTAKVTAVGDAATITLEASGGAALYVSLTSNYTTNLPLLVTSKSFPDRVRVGTAPLSGRFSDNALTVIPGEATTVTFIPIGPLADKPAAQVSTPATYPCVRFPSWISLFTGTSLHWHFTGRRRRLFPLEDWLGISNGSFASSPTICSVMRGGLCCDCSWRLSLGVACGWSTWRSTAAEGSSLFIARGGPRG